MRRRGFTLIEMIAVTGILALLAGIITPSLIAGKRSRETQAAVSKILQAANDARELSRQTGSEYELAYDDTDRTFSVRPFNPDNAGQSNIVGSTQPSVNQGVPANGTNNAPQDQPQGPSETLKLTDDFRLNASQVRGEDGSGSNWNIHFYADGTCDPGFVEFNVEDLTVRLRIDAAGRLTLQKGPRQDEQENWPAGELEQRNG